MTIAQLLAFLAPFAIELEPLLVGFESNTVMPALEALIAKETSPDLKLLLQALATGLDAFAKAEIAKIG